MRCCLESARIRGPIQLPDRKQIEQIDPRRKVGNGADGLGSSVNIRTRGRLPIAKPVPQIGPASPTRASSTGFAGCCFIRTKAPTNGMNIGGGRGEAKLSQRPDMTHLMNINGRDNPERKSPPVDAP